MCLIVACYPGLLLGIFEHTFLKLKNFEFYVLLQRFKKRIDDMNEVCMVRPFVRIVLMGADRKTLLSPEEQGKKQKQKTVVWTAK